MLSSVDMMVKRSLESELSHVNLMLTGQIDTKNSLTYLAIVKQYLEQRLEELS